MKRKNPEKNPSNDAANIAAPLLWFREIFRPNDNSRREIQQLFPSDRDGYSEPGIKRRRLGKKKPVTNLP